MNAAPDLHALTGAYAVHALPEEERAAFERHLARCPACALEVAEFEVTAARLGAAESVEPPPALKARVLAGLGEIRQLPPRTAPAARLRRASRPGPRLSRTAVAACLALAAALGALAVQQHGRADRAEARARVRGEQQAAVNGLLTAPDARTSTAVSGPAVGTVVWSAGREQAAFLVTGLPVLPPGRTYQLWFSDGGTMRPAGLLPAGDGQLLLTGRVGGAVGVGVTEEPYGGSARPTGAPLMLLPLA
ncbi:Transmembrane transcriptional regulator (anti-sigma factor RsiW) [Streptomyces sp. TLI_053]|uniref:anti-sigma factor n=1 Tax=Streptomyces sp. TLI_053 TaxID=1855352 RepID=UPI00087CCA8D|nr:anti-sigma factor [Streptomyces sp. TLI_053]SDS87281.1 Transmembrane transcriptional regulator (anti-sigma factor RsiW) [Streptomyces sp. TLI_053]